MTDSRVFTVRMTLDLRQRLRIRSIQENRSANALVIQAIEDHLAREAGVKQEAKSA